MAKLNGTLFVIEMDGVAIARATAHTMNTEQDLPDASNKDSAGYAEHIRGQRSGSFDIEGLVDFAATFGYEGLMDMILNRTDAVAKFTTNQTGNLEWTVTVDLSSISLDAPNEDITSWSGTLQWNGTPVQATTA